jgi:hypothetical protein
MICVAAWLEFHRAGTVVIADGVIVPNLPWLKAINLYIAALVGGVVILTMPICIIAERTLWRQSDIIVRLWDRVAELEHRSEISPDES